MTSDNTPRGAAGAGIWANLGVWTAFGSAVGLVVGMLLGNMALGLALGSAAGVVVGVVFLARRNTRGGS